MMALAETHPDPSDPREEEEKPYLGDISYMSYTEIAEIERGEEYDDDEA
jgi:hypothetical protein